MTTRTARTADRTITLRCIAWSHERTAHEHELCVEPDGSVLVWDGQGAQWTRCHSLSASAARKARRFAVSADER